MKIYNYENLQLILSPVGESCVAIPRVGLYPSYLIKGVGVSRVYLVGWGGKEGAGQMFLQFGIRNQSKILVRCPDDHFQQPRRGPELSKKSYISFQRPSKTRAFLGLARHRIWAPAMVWLS